MAEVASASGEQLDSRASRPGILKLLRLGLSYTPLITRVSLSHSLNLAATSPYNDVRTAVTVAAIRAFLAPSERSRNITLPQAQRRTIIRVPVRGRVWISRYTCPVPPEAASVQACVEKAIESQAAGHHDTFPVVQMPDVVPVEGEWTGYRAEAQPSEPLPKVSEEEKYARMMRGTRSPETTILYFHGGAHAFMDPSTHRTTVKKLAKITGGRAFSVRYRLAPQNVFPSALVDCFVAYLTLLYPPPGAFHEAVEAKHLVLAGDSAGGNLAMGLIQLLVDLNRMGEHVMWHGEARPIPVPAAVAGNSPWLDITHSSLPFYSGDVPEAFDYIGPPSDLGRHGYKPCETWPSSPPRKYVYATDDMLTHPYVTSTMRRDWTGFPPVYLCIGWERLAYENKFLAQKLWRDGVAVVLDEFEAMPHCFALVVTKLAESRRCLNAWAGFIRQAAEGETLTSRATTIQARTVKETPLDFEDLCDVSDEVVRQRVVDTIEKTRAWNPFASRL